MNQPTLALLLLLLSALPAAAFSDQEADQALLDAAFRAADLRAQSAQQNLPCLFVKDGIAQPYKKPLLGQKKLCIEALEIEDEALRQAQLAKTQDLCSGQNTVFCSAARSRLMGQPGKFTSAVRSEGCLTVFGANFSGVEKAQVEAFCVWSKERGILMIARAQDKMCDGLTPQQQPQVRHCVDRKERAEQAAAAERQEQERQRQAQELERQSRSVQEQLPPPPQDLAAPDFTKPGTADKPKPAPKPAPRQVTSVLPPAPTGKAVCPGGKWERLGSKKDCTNDAEPRGADCRCAADLNIGAQDGPVTLRR